MNSKVLFKNVRHRPAGSTAMPVMVHISEWQMYPAAQPGSYMMVVCTSHSIVCGRRLSCRFTAICWKQLPWL
jgi:hypothetical protein